MLNDEDRERVMALRANSTDRTAKIILDLAREVAILADLDGPADVFAPSKKPAIVGLRHVIMYRAHEMGCSIRSIAAAMHCNWQTVQHGIEKERRERNEH